MFVFALVVVVVVVVFVFVLDVVVAFALGFDSPITVTVTCATENPAVITVSPPSVRLGPGDNSTTSFARVVGGDNSMPPQFPVQVACTAVGDGVDVAVPLWSADLQLRNVVWPCLGDVHIGTACDHPQGRCKRSTWNDLWPVLCSSATVLLGFVPSRGVSVCLSLLRLPFPLPLNSRVTFLFSSSSSSLPLHSPTCP